MMSWYLRKDNGKLYGPVSLDELKSWVAFGRIAPDDQVSQDRETWMYAANLDALQMDWVLRFPDGTEYGPLHVMSLREMLEDGDVDPMTPVSHKESQEVRRVWELVLTAVLKLNVRLQASVDELTDQLSSAEQHLMEKSSTGQDSVEADSSSRQEWTSLQTALAEREKEIARWKALYEDIRSRSEADELAHEEESRRLSKEQLELTGENERLRLKLVQAEKRLQAFQQSDTSSHNLDGVTAAYHELAAAQNVLSDQMLEKSAEIAKLLESRRQVELQAERSVQSMSDRLHREQEEADAARRRYAEIEESHLDLVRSYRELNDRYIRLRQERGNPEFIPPVSVSGKSDASVPATRDQAGRRRKSKIKLNR